MDENGGFFTVRVYYELTTSPPPRWFNSSFGRAPHWYRRSRSWVRFPFRPELFSDFNFTDA